MMTNKKLDLPQAVFHPCKGYPGVKYLLSASRSLDGKPERVYYIRYRTPDGRQHFEKAGKLTTTPAKAAGVRRDRSLGKEPPNEERREEKAAAIAAEKTVQEAVANRWTFDKLWKAWKEDEENVGKRGTHHAEARYRKHIKGPLGDREPKDLTPWDVDQLRLRLAKDHARETTLSVLNLVNRIARYGLKKGKCPGLPFIIDMRKKKMGREPRIKVAPSDEQIAAYIKTCREWPDVQARNFQLLLCYTGMRRGSAWNLKWEDVNLDTGRIVLRNSKNTRDIPILLAKDAVDLLDSHPRTEGNPYVFTGADPSGRRSERQTSVIPRQIRDAAGLPKTFDPNHIWRINLATQGRRKGIDTFYIQAMGGWESPAMVDHYAKVNEEVLREKVEMIATVLRGKTTDVDVEAPATNESAS
jgi:integrase